MKKLIGVLFVFFFIICIGVGILFLTYIQSAPPLDPKLLKDPISSKVYDMNGELIVELGQEKRTRITYQDIPKVVEDAFIATEDARFYEHFGIDFKRILGAIVANITEGFGAQGASTITQQVVKNSFLSPEKSIKRKVQDQWLAIQLDQQFSKQQILEMYLNKIYFSKGAYGIAKAADVYFGKSLDELALHEAALLAGIPQSPNNYNPFRHPEAAEKRRNIVLSLMVQHGKITEAEAEKAKAIPVGSTLVKVQEKPDPYDAFIDQVLDEIATLGDIDVYSGGLEIYTTVDPKAQAFVEEVLNTDKHIKYPNNDFQAGLVLLDTQTGEIRAIGGGRKQKVARGFNFATDINRQPGSTIKPIIDYGPAIEHLQWSTYHQIVDEPYQYSNGKPIHNWDNRYKGEISIRTALAESRNIPALKTLQAVGLDKAQDFASGLGLDFDPIYEADAIGGNNGTSPIRLAGAYSAFGNNGIYIKPHAIRKVVFPDDREMTLVPEPHVAMEDYTAYLVTNLLKSVVTTGTGTAANVPGLNIAGKTGTTNFDDATKKKYNIKSGVPDIWFSGYTPSYTMSIWTGYAETTEENYITGNQTQIAKQLFKTIMQEISKNKDSKEFTMPDSVVKVPIEKGTNPAKLPSEFTPKDQIVYEYFVKGTEPTTVSEKFGQIDPPQNVEIVYGEALDRLLLKWDYPNATEDISFQVETAIDDQQLSVYETTKNKYSLILNPEKGVTYHFKLIAMSDLNPENKSEAITVKIDVPREDGEMIPDPLDEQLQDDKPNEQKRQNNQGESENEGDNHEDPQDNQESENNQGVELPIDIAP